MSEDSDRNDPERIERRPDGTFTKGNTANRNGRPPGSKNLLTIFNDKRDEKITLKINGRPVKMSRQEAWVENLWNKAIACDPKASSIVLAMLRASGQLTPAPSEVADLSEDDAAVLDELVRRLAAVKKQDDDDE